MVKKFTKQDRRLVIKELERIQKVSLERFPVSQKLFVDKNGKFYCIFGGTGDWHGVPAPLMVQIERHASKTLLVIAKKYTTRINICVASAEEFVANKKKLPRTSVGGYQFHTVVEEDGVRLFQIPEVELKKISEIVLPLQGQVAAFGSDISKIINIDMLPSAKMPKIEDDEEATHSDIQAKLLLIGSYLGYRTFTPDKSKISRYGKLGDLCSEKDIPSDYVPARQIATVKNIDVIWFDQDALPTHCFEVEHSTDVTKGLLRLYQIRKLRIKMFIVAENKAKNKFEAELKKDPFYQVKEEYIFKTYGELEDFFDSVKRFTLLKDSFLIEQQLPKQKQSKANE
jgi:hypothetical protein